MDRAPEIARASCPMSALRRPIFFLPFVNINSLQLNKVARAKAEKEAEILRSQLKKKQLAEVYDHGDGDANNE
jgi:hypothetical protein